MYMNGLFIIWFLLPIQQRTYYKYIFCSRNVKKSLVMMMTINVGTYVLYCTVYVHTCSSYVVLAHTPYMFEIRYTIKMALLLLAMIMMRSKVGIFAQRTFIQPQIYTYFHCSAFFLLSVFMYIYKSFACI